MVQKGKKALVNFLLVIGSILGTVGFVISVTKVQNVPKQFHEFSESFDSVLLKVTQHDGQIDTLSHEFSESFDSVLLKVTQHDGQIDTLSNNDLVLSRGVNIQDEKLRILRADIINAFNIITEEIGLPREELYATIDSLREIALAKRDSIIQAKQDSIKQLDVKDKDAVIDSLKKVIEQRE